MFSSLILPWVYSSSQFFSNSAHPYLSSKNLRAWEAAAAGAGNDLVRCSIFRMDDVSGSGPVSLRGEFPVARPPVDECLAEEWVFDDVVVLAWEEMDDEVDETDDDLETLFRASD